MLATEWAEIVATQAVDDLTEVENATLIEQPVFAKLKARRGAIQYDQGGVEQSWGIKKSLPEPDVFTGGVIDFETSQKHIRASIDDRNMIVTDSMNYEERLKNKGPGKLIDRYAEIIPDMEEAISQNLALSVYADGVANTLAWSGLETFLSTQHSSYTAGAADRVAIPNDTYAGLSCAPGAEGNWSTSETTKPNATFGYDWPMGYGDPEFHFWSPRLYNWSSTAWTGQTTWIENCEYALRYAILWGKVGQSKNSTPDLCVMNAAMWNDYVNHFVARTRALMPNDELREMGFGEALSQEGVGMMQEWGVPANTAYLINTRKVKIRCLTPKLFDVHGPEWDIDTLSWKFLIGCWGNYRWLSPKYQAKLYNYA